jgi:hypothetical protein
MIEEHNNFIENKILNKENRARHAESIIESFYKKKSNLELENQKDKNGD